MTVCAGRFTPQASVAVQHNTCSHVARDTLFISITVLVQLSFTLLKTVNDSPRLQSWTGHMHLYHKISNKLKLTNYTNEYEYKCESVFKCLFIRIRQFVLCIVVVQHARIDARFIC